MHLSWSAPTALSSSQSVIIHFSQAVITVSLYCMEFCPWVN